MQERAPAATVSPRQLAADLAAAFLFSTRLPLTGVPALTGADIARAGWALPVAGAIVGLISPLVYWLAPPRGAPPPPPPRPTPSARPPPPRPLPPRGLWGRRPSSPW